MKRVAAFVLCTILVFAPLHTFGAQADTDQVLRGIPAIAKAFAPLAGVNWREFAQVLAGICAVESRCDPTYPHYTSSGVYSQYQGLFQMNGHQVTLAEQQLPQMLQRMQPLVSSGQIPQDAFNFVQQAVEQARASSGDRRFLPAYGIILGATKHIQLNKQLAEKYPGDPVRQAAGHMTAQFSGITEGKIRARQFNAAITGCATCTNTEAWALSVNRVNAQGLTVAGAIEAAGSVYESRMRQMMQRMAQVTNNMELVPPSVPPFTPPQYRPGGGPMLSVPYSGVSTLMESGYIRPAVSPYSYPQSLPRSVYESSLTPQNLGQQPGLNQPTTSQPTGGVPLSSMQIIVQPQTIQEGESVLVSWTSVNMRSGCVVTKNGSSFDSGSEGAKRDTLESGTISYKLSCTNQSGAVVESTATVTVQ